MRAFGRLFLIVLVLYIGAYAWMRHTGALVHQKGKDGHVIQAKASTTAPASASGAGDEADVAMEKSRGALGETKTTILDALFWPLCKGEAAVRDMQK